MPKDLFKDVAAKPSDEAPVKEKPATAPAPKTKPEEAPVVEPVKETPPSDATPEELHQSQEQAPFVPSEPQPEPANGPVDEPTENAPGEPVDADEDDLPDDAPQVDELAFLKQRADLMGLTYSNNIGVEALRAKITAKTEAENTSSDDEIETPDDEPEVVEDPDHEVEAGASAPIFKEHSNVTGLNPDKAASYTKPRNKNKKMSARAYVMREKTKLVRLRITNLDPKKKDLHGEVLTVANSYIGTIRKFVPFGEQTDNGFHVPYCIYELLRDRRFLNIRTRKGKFNTPVVEQIWSKEFALEVLPPLTPEELNKLSMTQQAAGYGLED
jgi:hypothetical protein